MFDCNYGWLLSGICNYNSPTHSMPLIFVQQLGSLKIVTSVCENEKDGLQGRNSQHCSNFRLFWQVCLAVVASKKRVSVSPSLETTPTSTSHNSMFSSWNIRPKVGTDPAENAESWDNVWISPSQIFSFPSTLESVVCYWFAECISIL